MGCGRGQTAGVSRRTLLDLCAATLCVVAAAPAAYLLVGDHSFRGLPDEQLDRLVQPPPLGRTSSVSIGVGCALVVVIAVCLLHLPGHALRADHDWRPVLAVPLVTAAAVGASGRVFTDGVVGANIGAGLLVLVEPVVVLAVLVWVARRSRTVRRHGART